MFIHLYYQTKFNSKQVKIMEIKDLLELVKGESITVTGSTPLSQLILEGIIIEAPQIDEKGNYADENDIICLCTIYLENENQIQTGETIERYVYYDFETNNWTLLEGWHLD